MINNKLVLAYMAKVLIVTIYLLSYKDQISLLLKRYLILGLDMIYGKLLMELSMLRMLIRY